MKARSLLSYAVVVLFLGWCAIALRADIAQIRVEPIWAAREAILVAALLSVGNYALRVARWSLYLRRLGHVLAWRFTTLTYLAGFAFTLSPGKAGEMLRGRFYLAQGVPFSSTAAAFVVERLMDLLAMLALALLALASTTAYAPLVWGTSAVIAAVLVVLARTPWDRVAAWAERSATLPAWLRAPLQGVLRTLLSARALLNPALLGAGFLIGLVAWGAEGVGLMVIGDLAPGVTMGWAAATGIYSVAIIVGALSFLPGGLGSTEAVMIAMLAAHGYAMPDAILLTLVCRLLTLWLAVALGWIAVFMLRRHPPAQRAAP